MERRTFSRISACVHAAIKAGDRVLEGRIVNASLKGMFIRTPGKLAAGDEVELTIHPPDSEPGPPMTCRARVVRVEPLGAAVELQDMSEESLTQLHGILFRHSHDPQRTEDEIRTYAARPR